MRIEQQNIQGVNQLQQTEGQQLLALDRGQVVRAIVLSQKDGAVTLRSQDGGRIQARLMAEMPLNPADEVEMIVTGKSGNTLSLQLLSVFSSGTGSARAADGLQTLISQLNAADQEQAAAIMAALKDMGAVSSRQTLQQALQIMQETELSAKEAAFFAANQIPVTEEAVKAFLAVQQGQTAGPILFALAREAAVLDGTYFPETQPAPAQEAAVQPGVVPQALAEEGPLLQEPATDAGPEQIQPGLQNEAAPGETRLGQENGVPLPSDTMSGRDLPLRAQDTNAQAAQPELQAETAGNRPAQPEQILQERQAQADAAQAEQAQRGGEPPAYGGGAEALPAQEKPDAAIPGQAGAARENPTPGLPAEPDRAASMQNPKEEINGLSERLLSLFMEVDGGVDGAKIKKAAAETAFRSEILKDMLETAASKNKTFAERMTDVAAQTKLTQDVQRFYCMHIPVHHHVHDTAELYIYRNKKRGKGIDPEDTAILIGLATETMGRVESLIRVEKRNISLVFSVEAEEAIPYMKEYARGLYPVLKQHNYTLLDAKVNRLDRETTLANAEEQLSAAVRRPNVFVDYRI